MPMYFFCTDDGTYRAEPQEGLELTGPAEARAAVLSSLPDMARDTILNGDRRIISASAQDADGRTVYTATLTLEGRWGV